jgi:hypothetical protein
MSLRYTASVERADTAQLFEKYRELARTPGNVAVSRGDANAIDAIPVSVQSVSRLLSCPDAQNVTVLLQLVDPDHNFAIRLHVNESIWSR